MTTPTDHPARMDRAHRSLLGLSVGDAFGERFFVQPGVIVQWLGERRVGAEAPWPWTDDTAMAISIVEVLDELGSIDPDALAERLATRYWHERWRGYGGGAHRLFEAIADGTPWRVAAAELFGKQGSFGNGGAMRVAPLGAYFADDLDAVVEMARRSAIPTHAHPEGQAGAIAVAVAAAVLWQTRELAASDAVARMFDEVLARTPAGKTHEGIREARGMIGSGDVERAVNRLGNGSGVSSQDTVPLCMWAVARHPRDFAEAMWTTVAGLGDRDTTCAIVGGIVAAGGALPPAEWIAAREPLPTK
ncbi:MAG TPA: ADP-ribosylglycohydrolase family protein [Enhygromyxa sp.]|nr:ADP-ribosylglycohydrolase family protein [Enhygromyxa sp.]